MVLQDFTRASIKPHNLLNLEKLQHFFSDSSSRRLLLKCVFTFKTVFQSRSLDFANHIANYVQFQTGIMPQNHCKKHVSLITAVGTDLIDHIISFVEEEDTLKILFQVCKTVNQFAMKRTWRRVSIEWDFANGYRMRAANTPFTLNFVSRGIGLVEELSLDVVSRYLQFRDGCDFATARFQAPGSPFPLYQRKAIYVREHQSLLKARKGNVLME
jgi:hypothetical protein